MLALSGDPPAAGVNVTAIVHEELPARLAPQVPPVTPKSIAFAPLMLSPNGSKNPDLFVTVTFSVLDFIFEVSVPKASVAGVTVAGIIGPVPSATV
jgi:hypothetical protein